MKQARDAARNTGKHTLTSGTATPTDKRTGYQLTAVRLLVEQTIQEMAGKRASRKSRKLYAWERQLELLAVDARRELQRYDDVRHYDEHQLADTLRKFLRESNES